MPKKRFNIWIAYSDLFSNLAVFLFISAFGVFAALGSIANVNSCLAPSKDVGDMLTSRSASGQKSGLTLRPAGSASGCLANYDLTVPPDPNNHYHRHHRGKPAVTRSDPDGTAPAPDVYRYACEQIWGAVTRADMASRGQITIVGTIGRDAGLTCPDTNADPEHTGLPWKERMHEVDCWQEPGHGTKDPNCKAFVAKHPSGCLLKDNSSRKCVNLTHRLERDDYRRTECLRPDAAKQAANLYSTCRDALLDDGFEWGLISAKGNALSGQYENYTLLNHIWNDTVRYRGEVSTANQDRIYLEVRADGGSSH